VTSKANTTDVLTGRCYCGKTTVSTTQAPQTVAYCHCTDCRRWTSAPVAAFAAFDENEVAFFPNEGRQVSATPGVTRTFCSDCGTPLTGRYDYLPGQVYIGVSIFDQCDDLEARIHCHEASRLNWLNIDDQLPRVDSSARTKIKVDL